MDEWKWEGSYGGKRRCGRAMSYCLDAAGTSMLIIFLDMVKSPLE